MIFKVLAQSTVSACSGDAAVTGRPFNSPDEGFMNLSGFSANVCYSNGYDADSIDGKLHDYDKNVDRFHRVIGTGHHSIADHPTITVYMGGISKMMAMILNSLGMYATSERSARYTNVAKSASEPEVVLYEKWKKIISSMIEKMYPSIEANRREKLAMENARYFISVMNPSTCMVYTTSYRQLSYIAQWFDRFSECTKYSTNNFISCLRRDMIAMRDAIIGAGVGNTEIEDIKHRSIRFLARQADDIILDCEEQYGYSYHVAYKCSFSCLAQAQRHRTLNYFMDYDPDDENPEFYVPPILFEADDDSLVQDWLKDMKSVAYLIPQGTLVKVHEEGNVHDLVLKSKERLCGRAQLEIALNTAYTIKKIMDNSTVPAVTQYLYNTFVCRDVDSDILRAKCQLIGGCKEPCEFGPTGALSRRI